MYQSKQNEGERNGKIVMTTKRYSEALELLVLGEVEHHKLKRVVVADVRDSSNHFILVSR